MVPRGAPEVLKLSPRMSKWRHVAPLTTPRSQKGPAAEGAALKRWMANKSSLLLRNIRETCDKTSCGSMLHFRRGSRSLERRLLWARQLLCVRFISEFGIINKLQRAADSLKNMKGRHDLDRAQTSDFCYEFIRLYVSICYLGIRTPRTILKDRRFVQHF